MRKLTIDFTAENILPDGSVLGYVGEHNATELIIKPPEDMLNYPDLSHISVVFSKGTKKVTSGAISATEQISLILSRDFTTVSVISLQLEGFDENDNLLVKSDKIEDLIFEGSINGEEYLGADEQPLISAIRQNTLSRHSHDNKDVLDGLSVNGENLMFNGQSIGGGTSAVIGSKYYANDYNEGLILADGSALNTIDFLINEEYPENRIITGVSVHINEDGEIKKYSLLRLHMNGLLNGTAIPHISQKTEPESSYGMFEVAFISNLDSETSDFYTWVSYSPENVAGFTVHYIEI